MFKIIRTKKLEELVDKLEYVVTEVYRLEVGIRQAQITTETRVSTRDNKISHLIDTVKYYKVKLEKEKKFKRKHMLKKALILVEYRKARDAFNKGDTPAVEEFFTLFSKPRKNKKG